MKSLSEELNNIERIVRHVFSDGEAEDYFTTLFTITDTTVEVDQLHGNFSSSDEILAVFEAFGYKKGKKRKIPEAIFVAAESIGEHGSEAIMITGCTSTFEVTIGYLRISRNAAGRILPGAWTGPQFVPPKQIERIGAFRAMRGAVAKSTAPWWKR